jgi:hypothetical protein
MIVGASVMLGLILFGLAFGSRFGATECRRLQPDIIVAGSPAAGAAALTDAAAVELVTAAVGEGSLAALVDEHGGLRWARELPLDGMRRIAPDPDGVLVTGAGALLVEADGAVLAGARFGSGVEVVGDGTSVYAVVVGNIITGQVDALRPLQLARQGVTRSACVDTSAVGSPLSFLHDAREGLLVGLRTDEDGSESVLELRDPSRGRVWAPPVLLGQAPAGLQGARTTGRIAGDVVVLTRRLSDVDTVPEAVLAFDRMRGEPVWTITADVLRAALDALDGAALAAAPTLRLELADVPPEDRERDPSVMGLLVTPDVAADALLPPPLYGPFADLVSDADRIVREGVVDAGPAATVLLDLADGSIREVRAGRPPRRTDALLRAARGAWLLIEVEAGPDLLVRFGG